MNKDLLGQQELDSIKINWNFAVPGLMTTRCCGTGTCDNQPTNNFSNDVRMIYFFRDSKKPSEIARIYGYLR